MTASAHQKPKRRFLADTSGNFGPGDGAPANFGRGGGSYLMGAERTSKKGGSAVGGPSALT